MTLEFGVFRFCFCWGTLGGLEALGLRFCVLAHTVKSCFVLGACRSSGLSCAFFSYSCDGTRYSLILLVPMVLRLVSGSVSFSGSLL